MTAPLPTDEPATPPRPARSPFDVAAIVLVASAALLLAAGIVYAFAVADARDVAGSERFRLLAQASSPFVAGLVLAAVALVVHERRRGLDPTIVGGAAVLSCGSVVAVLALLLALNGVVVDLSTANLGGLFRLSNVLGRLATVLLSAFALWLAAVPGAPPRHR